MSRHLTDQERVWRSVPEADVLRAVLDHVARLGGYAVRLNTGADIEVLEHWRSPDAPSANHPVAGLYYKVRRVAP